MSLSFTDTTGNLFNRLGRLGKVIANAKSLQTSQETAFTSLADGIIGQFESEPDIQAIMGSSYIGLLNAIGNSSTGAMQSIARATVNRMVYRDYPQLNQNLTSINLSDSLRYVVQQMKDQVYYVLACTVAASVNAFDSGFTGNGKAVVSVKRPLDGVTLENAFAETLTFTCIGDSYEDGETAGNETFLVRGEGNQGNFFAFDWPLGSNGSITVSCIDGDQDDSSGNLLTNSGFDAWTGGAPDNWTEVTGGSLITQEVALSYTEGSALCITGDGVTLPSITQLFDDDSGTIGAVEGITQYSVCLFMRRDGTPATNGTLTVDLIDQDGNVIEDEAGNDNTFDIDLTALTVNYLPYTGVFRLPYIMPTTVRIRVHCTGTALTSGRAVYLDKMSLGEMVQLYVQGPYVAIHSGSVPFRNGVYCTAEVTNSRGAAGTLNTWQVLWARLFPTAWNNELLLPSSNSPNISDLLITR